MDKKKAEIKVYCSNDGEYHMVEAGTPLYKFSKKWCDKIKDPKTGKTLPVLAVMVDNVITDLNYKMYDPHTVEFVSYSEPEGRNSYIRSLCFVLQKAVSELYPDKVLIIEHSLPSGLYCEIVEVEKAEDGRNIPCFLVDEEIDNLKSKMQEIIAADYPFIRHRVEAEEAEAIFLSHNQHDKVRLYQSLGQYRVDLYEMGGWMDTFHGPMVHSTGILTIFDLSGFSKGFCLQPPVFGRLDKDVPMKRQSKISEALDGHAARSRSIGIQ